jgi:CheY-like chemotaxis protein/HAMP domain-containing protein
VNGKIADTLNDVIEMNDRLVKELERVSRVVGREGKITQRAAPPVADGAWVSLIESVNTLIDDLAQPTTEMARVMGAVANGDLSQTMALEVDGRPLKGEFLRLVKLVNAMVTQLGSFASEVTRMMREVGADSSGDYGEIIEIADDRNDILPGDRVALIVEDDALFAQILLDLAHERGFKGVVAAQGDAALRLARRHRPDAITLDIRLPDRDGWTVLDRLKHDPKTSHIPVHVITADDREYQPRKLGALTSLQKPVTREQLKGAFPLSEAPQYTSNYLRSGGRKFFSEFQYGIAGARPRVDLRQPGRVRRRRHERARIVEALAARGFLRAAGRKTPYLPKGLVTPHPKARAFLPRLPERGDQWKITRIRSTSCL